MKINELLCEFIDLRGVIPPYGKGHIDFDEFLEKKCPIAYNSPIKIYRGVETNSMGYLLKGDSRESERVSANTDNYYTLIVDNILPEWKKFPKRSRSFICSTSMEISKAFGKLYRVYPIGDPLIGICQSNDFWTSFQNINLESFNYLFKELSDWAGIKPHDDLETTKHIIKVLDEKWNNKDSYFILHVAVASSLSMENAEVESFESFTQLLEWIFDPNRNKLELLKLSQLPKYMVNNHELWFSGPAYFVQIEDNR
jgi:hypothetical protein